MRDLTRAIRLGVAMVVAGGAGCRPTLDDRPWLIRQPQIVGWLAEPPEARPGGIVALRIVAIDPVAAPDTTTASWTLCHAAKPLDENRVVTADCLPPVPGAADAVGDPVMIAIPTDACRVFGPDTPQPAAGATPTRPHDPDATGGYYQPISIALGTEVAVGLERVSCDLPDASLAAARAFAALYHPNQNPVIATLSMTLDGAPIAPPPLGDVVIPPGARLHVQATWPDDAAEIYPVFDRSSGAVVMRREGIIARWYVTAGQLTQPVSRIADASAPMAATDWIAPETPLTLTITLMLADDRGGSAVAQSVLVVAGSP
jgi:hypothetical protein